MKNKRILILAIKPGAIGGGVTKIVERLKSELSVENYVDQWALLGGEELKDWKVLEGKKYKHTRKLSDLLKILHNYKAIYSSNSIKKELANISGYDYIVVTDPFAIPFIHIKDTGKLIFQIHSSLTEKNAYTIQIKYLLKKYHSKIDKVTCGDEKDLEYLKKYHFEKVVLNNFPTVEYQGYKELGNNKLIYFGLIQKFKRITELANWATSNKIELDIRGNVVDYSEDEIEAMKSEYVKVNTNRYEHADIYNKFSQYSAFVINSMVEGKTMAVSEAISVGLPVVISKDLINVDEMLCNEGIDINNVTDVRKLISEEEFNKKVYLLQSQKIKDYTYENYVKELF